MYFVTNNHDRHFLNSLIGQEMISDDVFLHKVVIKWMRKWHRNEMETYMFWDG